MELWIQTYSGKKFWPLSPKSKDICLEDIAWALSLKCRYSGHCNRFYSVLEHSLLVSEFCERYPIEGLFHDAAEAYLPDIPSPIKHMFSQLVEIENNLLRKIFIKYNLTWPLPNEVDIIDKRILANEQKELMPKPPEDWHLPYPAIDSKILSYIPILPPKEAMTKFMILCDKNGIKD